jgi:hypothetical protein
MNECRQRAIAPVVIRTKDYQSVRKLSGNESESIGVAYALRVHKQHPSSEMAGK